MTEKDRKKQRVKDRQGNIMMAIHRINHSNCNIKYHFMHLAAIHCCNRISMAEMPSFSFGEITKNIEQK